MKTLLVIDMQKDFMPGGRLPVFEGDHIVPIINDLMERFPTVIATQDWHPKGHVSFEQWGEHCVRDSLGAEFAPGLNVVKFDRVIRKGSHVDRDQLSAFDGEIRADEVTVVGVATEVCILHTVLDALDRGRKVTVFAEACRPIDRERGEKALLEMERSGAHLKRVREVFA